MMERRLLVAIRRGITVWTVRLQLAAMRHAPCAASSPSIAISTRLLGAAVVDILYHVHVMRSVVRSLFPVFLMLWCPCPVSVPASFLLRITNLLHTTHCALISNLSSI